MGQCEACEWLMAPLSPPHYRVLTAENDSTPSDVLAGQITFGNIFLRFHIQPFNCQTGDPNKRSLTEGPLLSSSLTD